MPDNPTDEQSAKPLASTESKPVEVKVTTAKSAGTKPAEPEPKPAETTAGPDPRTHPGIPSPHRA
jgi:hypothetical protein